MCPCLSQGLYRDVEPELSCHLSAVWPAGRSDAPLARSGALVGGGQVEAQSAGPRADQEDEGAAVLAIELVHLDLPLRLTTESTSWLAGFGSLSQTEQSGILHSSADIQAWLCAALRIELWTTATEQLRLLPRRWGRQPQVRQAAAQTDLWGRAVEHNVGVALGHHHLLDDAQHADAVAENQNLGYQKLKS